MSSSPAAGKREVLASAAQRVRDRRRLELDELLDLLAWADAHSGDPQGEPGAVPIKHGGPKLLTIGGEGTPGVDDLCFAEMAIARRAGEIATQHATADGLDLRHRLPATWAAAQGLPCEIWVVRKVARLSRSLSRGAVKIVDAAVAAALHESPYRILAIAEAKVIEADKAAHAERIERNRTKKGVWLSGPRVGDEIDDIDPTAGVRTLTGRLDEADAIELYESVDALADALAEHGDHDPDNPSTRDQLRAEALGLLGRPADALALLAGESEPADHDHGYDREDDKDREDHAGHEGGDGSAFRRRPGGRAVIHLHLSADAITGVTPGSTTGGIGVARVEGLGPRLLEELAALLRRRDITLQPVIDLNQVHNVNSYEHPTQVRRRTELRVHGDAFPHTTVSTGSTSDHRRIDHDHPTPYDRDGPPGQTGDTNDAPLTRRHHRAKTHQPYNVDQLALGVYRWRTPHGLARVVTPTGTRTVELLTDADGRSIGERYEMPSNVELD